MLIDIHSHLHHTDFSSNMDSIIENAKKNNLKIILSAGTDSKTNNEEFELSKKYDIVKACLGMYPIKEDGSPQVISDDDVHFFEKNKKHIAAVGEVGLDYHWTQEKKEQQELFAKMIQLAEKFGKPIIVHSRKAEADCIGMLASSKVKHIVMHCFSGNKKLVKEVIDKGWFLTAPTMIVRSSQFQENAALCPITQLFCETDAPYLSPFKDKRNEPAFVVEAYKEVAEIKKMDFEEVVKNIWMNWQRAFL